MRYAEQSKSAVALQMNEAFQDEIKKGTIGLDINGS